MQRFQDTFTGRLERSLLERLCRWAPAWMTSDMLTGLGLAGAMVTCWAFWMARLHAGFLCVALIGLALNWLGDSLDGSLARHRGTERPQYGFFLDHTVDGFAMAFIAIGVGLSPLAHLWCAQLALVGYYIMVVLALTTALSTGVFNVSYGGVGPTEIRLGIAAALLTALLLPIKRFAVLGVALTVYDLIILVFAAGLVVTAVLQTRATARDLAIIDPPHPR